MKKIINLVLVLTLLSSSFISASKADSFAPHLKHLRRTASLPSRLDARRKNIDMKRSRKTAMTSSFTCPEHERGVIVVKMKRAFTVKQSDTRKFLSLGLNSSDDFSVELQEYFKKSHSHLNLSETKQRFAYQGSSIPANFKSKLSASKLQARKLKAAQIRDQVGVDRIYHMQVKEQSCAELMKMIDELKRDPSIEYAQPKYLYKRNSFNDPFLNTQGEVWSFDYPEMWTLDAIHAKDAWSISQGEGMVVAVIDDGVDYNHPDLWDNIWIDPAIVPDTDRDGDSDLDDADLNHDKYISNSEIVPYMFGYDFADGDKDPFSVFGHGTHVAGTIAAVANNDRGIVGVAPKAKLMILKGFSDAGSGSGLDLAVKYATDLVINGVVDKLVTNNSWGGYFYDEAFADLFKEAYLNSVISVAAAGNDSVNVLFHSPSNLPYVISVGASSFDSKASGFSNYGYIVDIFAPGGGDADDGSQYNILSTVNLNSELAQALPDDIVGKDSSDYAYLSIAGTSMASPHVAGAVALLWSKYPDYDIEDIRALLKQSSEKFVVDPAQSPVSTGIMNIEKALKEVKPRLYAKLFPQYGDYAFDVYDVHYIQAFMGGTDYDHYKLEYLDLKHPETERWITIRESSLKPSFDNISADFDFSLLTENENNKIKLTVYDKAGSKVEDLAEFYVNKYTIYGAFNPDDFSYRIGDHTFRSTSSVIDLLGRMISSILEHWDLKIFNSSHNDVLSKNFEVFSNTSIQESQVEDFGRVTEFALRQDSSKPASGAYQWTLSVNERDEFIENAASLTFVIDNNIHEHWPLTLGYGFGYYPQPYAHGALIANVSAHSGRNRSQILYNNFLKPIVLDGEAIEFNLSSITDGYYFETPLAANFSGDSQNEMLGIRIAKNLNNYREYLAVFNLKGNRLADYLLETIINTSSLSDLNLDGISEAVILGYHRKTKTTKAIVYNGAGKRLANLVSSVKGVIEGFPVVSDLDGDRYPDTAFVTSNSSYQLILNISNILKSSIESSQVVLESDISNLGEGKTVSDLVDLAAADLDGDNDKEIIVAYNYWGTSDRQHLKVCAYHHDGSLVSGWPIILDDTTTHLILSTIALGDLDNNGKAEVILGVRGENSTESSGYLYVLDEHGTTLPNWPVKYHSSDIYPDYNPGYHGMLVLNVDADTEKEIIAAKAVTDGISDKELIVAFNADASRVDDLVFYNNSSLGYGNNSLAIGNLDADDKLEIVYFGENQPIVYDTVISNTTKIDWAMAGHDAGASRALTLR